MTIKPSLVARRKRMTERKRLGMTNYEYMTRNRQPVYRKGVPVVKGRIQGDRDLWLRRTRAAPTPPPLPYPFGLFRRGSSMVGSRRAVERGRKLLSFHPTKAMIAQGYLPQQLRFQSAARATRLNIPFNVSPRQDWINKRLTELRTRGLL